MSLWQYNDGGRVAAGFRGKAGDCAVRAAAIVTGLPYREVYDAINALAERERPRRGGRRSNARTGVHGRTLRRFMDSLSWRWVPTMRIGSGCTIHLGNGELPAKGRLLVFVSRHFVAVIDGVIQDTHDPSRNGTRCVYGYYCEKD